MSDTLDMTLEQSLKNVEIVKSMAYLFNNDCVYLKFTSATEYEVIRLPELDDCFHTTMLTHLNCDNLPYGHMWIAPLIKKPLLRYVDANLNYRLDLATNESSITFPDTPVDAEEARQEYLELIRQFK